MIDNREWRPSPIGNTVIWLVLLSSGFFWWLGVVTFLRWVF